MSARAEVYTHTQLVCVQDCYIYTTTSLGLLIYDGIELLTTGACAKCFRTNLNLAVLHCWSSRCATSILKLPRRERESDSHTPPLYIWTTGFARVYVCVWCAPDNWTWRALTSSPAMTRVCNTPHCHSFFFFYQIIYFFFKINIFKYYKWWLTN